MVGIYIKVNECAIDLEKIHLDACKSLINDGDKFEVYSDLGNTRISRGKMLNAIKNGNINKIITYNFSRLARKHEEIIGILDLINTYQVELITFEEGEITNDIMSMRIEKSGF